MSLIYLIEKSNLTDAEKKIARRICATRGKNTGNLRTSKPPIKRIEHENPLGYYPIWEIKNGEAAFVWRHVAFMISENHRHHCMPVMAFCDLTDGVQKEDGAWIKRSREEQKEYEKKLMDLAGKIVDLVNPLRWNGVRRWAGLI